jgi:hypothetical protein
VWVWRATIMQSVNMAPGVRATACKTAMALLTAVLLAISPAPAAAAEDVAANQAAFENAMRAMQGGNLPLAILLLDGLSQRTNAPRVRLELARALFLNGEYREARRELLKVYRRDLPYPVRRSINVFLDDIDQRIGYLRPKVALAYDSNPTHAAPSGVYDILGAPLTYVSSAKGSASLSYRVDALQPIARRGAEQWQLVGAIDGTVFEQSDANRYGSELGLRYVQLDRRVHVTLGWRGTQNQAQRTSSPYVEYERRVTPARDRQITLAASAEVNRFPGQPYLRGQTARVAVAYARDLGMNTTGQVAAGGSLSTISDPQWPKRTAFGQVTLIRSVPKANLNLIASAGAAHISYDGRDLFFGKVRSDRSTRVEVALYHARPVFGLFPGVVASYEARRSNIEFYGYDRAGLAMDFRRRF